MLLVVNCLKINTKYEYIGTINMFKVKIKIKDWSFNFSLANLIVLNYSLI